MVKDPLNKQSFLPPNLAANEARARGFDPRHGFVNGGMGLVQRTHLAVGQNYFRFGDSTRFSADWKRESSGGWWVEYSTFSIIKNFAGSSEAVQDYSAKLGEAPISYAAKLMLAVPFEWGDCGVLIVARLKDRLDAFKGRGKIADLHSDPGRRDPRDGGALYIPLPNAEVAQLYIPDLPGLFDKAFDVGYKGLARHYT